MKVVKTIWQWVRKMPLFSQTTLAVSCACLNSQGDCNFVFRKAVAQDVISSAALPSLFPFVTRVLRVTGILQHCKISIFILVYPFSVAQLIFPSKIKQWLLPSFPSLAKSQFENHSGNSTESCSEAAVIHCHGQQWPFPSGSLCCSGSSVLLVYWLSEIRPLS